MQEQQEVPYAQFPINIISTMGAVHKQRHFKGGCRGVQWVPTFCDFRIRDPRYFVILFQAKFHDFEEKKKSEFYFFWIFFCFYSYL